MSIPLNRKYWTFKYSNNTLFFGVKILINIFFKDAKQAAMAIPEKP